MVRWQTIRSDSAPRHVHLSAYASVVISGGYEEAGDFGRFFLEPGDVLFHARFESHLDRFRAGGATVLNLPMTEGCIVGHGLFQAKDLDRIVRISERDSREALEALLSTVSIKTQVLSDWPDQLAAAIHRNPSLRLRDWAASNGLHGWTMTRGFRSVFDLPPEKYRARVRTMSALECIRGTCESLTQISVSTGFCDHSHMCRSIRALTGKPPNAWRAVRALLSR